MKIKKLVALFVVGALVVGGAVHADPSPSGGGLKPKPCATCSMVAPGDLTPPKKP